MVSQDLLKSWKSRLSSSVPLLGKRWRRTAVREMADHRDDPEVVTLLSKAVALSDPEVCSAARDALLRLTDQAAIDRLCAQWDQTSSEALLEIIREASYNPSDSILAARIALRRGDLAACLKHDPGQGVLKEAFLRDQEGVRDSVRTSIRGGELQLSTFLGSSVPFESLSMEDTLLGLDARARAGNWQDFFAACLTVPLQRSLDSWPRLFESGWQPSGSLEQKIWKEVLPLIHLLRSAGTGADHAAKGMRHINPCRKTTISHPEGVRHMAISPDGLRLAGAGQDGYLRIWDTGSGQMTVPPMKHNQYVDWAEFTPDGRRLISSSSDPINPTFSSAVFHIWDPQSGQPMSAPIDTGGDCRLTPPVIAANGRTLMAGLCISKEFGSDSFRFSVHVWNIETGKRMFATDPWFDQFGYGFSPCGQYAAGTNFPSTEIAVVDLTSGARRTRLCSEKDPKNFTFEPDHRFFAWSSEKNVFLWETASCKPVCGPLNHGDEVTQVRIRSDGRVMACSTKDKIFLWSIPDGQPIGGPIPFQCAYKGMRFLPNSPYVIAFDQKTTGVCFWDSAMGKQLAVSLGHEKPVVNLAASPSGKLIAAAISPNTDIIIGESSCIWSLTADPFAVWPQQISEGELSEMESQINAEGGNERSRLAMQVLKIAAQYKEETRKRHLLRNNL